MPYTRRCHILATFIKGPYDPTTATSMQTSLKNRLRIILNFLAIIPFRPVT